MPIWTVQWTKSIAGDGSLIIALTFLDANQAVLKTATGTLIANSSLPALLQWVEQQCTTFLYEQLPSWNAFPDSGSMKFGFAPVMPVRF